MAQRVPLKKKVPVRVKSEPSSKSRETRDEGRRTSIEYQASSNEQRVTTDEPRVTSHEPRDSSELRDIQSIKDDWPSILKIITARLGNGTGGLLSSAQPRRFEDGVLTLEFAASAKMQKEMCESNRRAEQIRSLLSEQFGRALKLKFEIADEEQAQGEAGATRPKTSSQRKNEIVNDPAVKTVLMGLDATITGIEEEPRN